MPLSTHSGPPSIHLANNEQITLGYLAAGQRRFSFVTDSATGLSLKTVQDSAAGAFATDCGFIYLPDGRIRMLAEERSPSWTRQLQRFHIVSYISNNGIYWEREDGIRYQPGAADDSIANLPAAIQVSDSVWRLYYCANFYAPQPNTTHTAISRDWGHTWQAESIQPILRSGDVDPYPMFLASGKIRLYFRFGWGKPPDQSGIAFCDSKDGLKFDTSAINICFRDADAPVGRKLDPAIIRFPNGEIVCFFGGDVRGESNILMYARGKSPNSTDYSPRQSAKISFIGGKQIQLQPTNHHKVNFYTVASVTGMLIRREVLTQYKDSVIVELAGVAPGCYIVRLDSEAESFSSLIILD